MEKTKVRVEIMGRSFTVVSEKSEKSDHSKRNMGICK